LHCPALADISKALAPHHQERKRDRHQGASPASVQAISKKTEQDEHDFARLTK
jgi:hypothetical protein